MSYEQGVELQRPREHPTNSDRVRLGLVPHPGPRSRRSVAAVLARTHLGLREELAARELERGVEREGRRHDVERGDVDRRRVPCRADAVEELLRVAVGAQVEASELRWEGERRAQREEGRTA